MALFYSEKFAKKTPKPTACSVLTVQSLDYQGLGVAKQNGKTWFVENALPDEQVEVRVIEEKRHYGRAQAVKILRKSANRQTPSCTLYQRCGGCQMQHIPLALQREAKQNALFSRLQKLQSEPIDFQPMLIGEDKAYRRRARLSIAFQNGQYVMGFRQASSPNIIPLEQCEVLVKPLSQLLPFLQRLVANWSQPKRLGHIELVEASNGTAMLLRHIGQLAEKDRLALLAFAETQCLNLFVMSDENLPELWRGEPPFYRLHGLALGFSIRDFIQVNERLNAEMVSKALDWLALSKQDRVLDLFCGMGNFTLPMALQAHTVIGVEGVAPMVAQAKENAKRNHITNAQFYQTDLAAPFHSQQWASEPFNKVLLDPARQGALFALDHLCALNPERIVYVSCNPATLVRDAEHLVKAGYRLQKSAMIDMFPHTGHLESISLFQK